MVNYNERTFRLSHFSENRMSTVNSEWTIVWEYSIPDGKAVALGRGLYADQHRAVGRLYAEIKNDSDSGVNGQIRFTVRTPNNDLIPGGNLGEFDLDEISVGASDRTSRYPFPLKPSPESFAFFGKEYKLCVELITDSDQTISTSNSTLKADGYIAERTN